MENNWFFRHSMQVKIRSGAAWVILHFGQGGKTLIPSTWRWNRKLPLGNLARAAWMHLLFLLIKAAPRLLQAYNSWTVTTLHKVLISYLRWEAMSEKIRQPSLLVFLRQPSLANLSSISLPKTFACEGTHWK